MSDAHQQPYRGRLAPSPTGYLHLGHARTFSVAYRRARARGGTLILRNEDLDAARSRPEFAAAMIEDLRWLGLNWDEGPDVGGPSGPYAQSERGGHYKFAWSKLLSTESIYPCVCTRKELASVAQAPHESGAPGAEPLYPGTCRPAERGRKNNIADFDRPGDHNWRFRVPDGEAISFIDLKRGVQQFVAGRDFGDFLVWRRDGVPSYQLAVTVDDALMRVTEVVRGADLLLSTARQLLLQKALGFPTPDYYHCDLMTDGEGNRLAKRHDALSLRALRAADARPEELLASFDQ